LKKRTLPKFRLSNRRDSSTIGSDMKTRISAALLVLAIFVSTAAAAKDPTKDKDKKEPEPPAPIGWLHLPEGTQSFSVPEPDLQKATRKLPRGVVLPVFKTKEKHGTTFAQMKALNFESGKMELGWVRVSPSDIQPASTYPFDSDLLKLLGAPYLDDFTAGHTDIARYLVRQAQGPPALLCYVLTAPLSMAKLVVFTPQQGKYLPGGALNIVVGEMQPGITALEVRDLVGDGSDSVISTEPFREQVETYGKNVVIRKIAGGNFRIIWQAPMEYHNLSEYSAKMQILQPPEKNIGAPGTVTKGEVTYRRQGAGQEPVWKGKVDFFVAGREKPLDSLNIEKACAWDGKEFVPLTE
jgi:hypothetical protein